MGTEYYTSGRAVLKLPSGQYASFVRTVLQAADYASQFQLAGSFTEYTEQIGDHVAKLASTYVLDTTRLELVELLRRANLYIVTDPDSKHPGVSFSLEPPATNQDRLQARLHYAILDLLDWIGASAAALHSQNFVTKTGARLISLDSGQIRVGHDYLPIDVFDPGYAQLLFDVVHAIKAIFHYRMLYGLAVTPYLQPAIEYGLKVAHHDDYWPATVSVKRDGKSVIIEDDEYFRPNFVGWFFKEMLDYFKLHTIAFFEWANVDSSNLDPSGGAMAVNASSILHVDTRSWAEQARRQLASFPASQQQVSRVLIDSNMGLACPSCQQRAQLGMPRHPSIIGLDSTDKGIRIHDDASITIEVMCTECNAQHVVIYQPSAMYQTDSGNKGDK